MALIQSKVLKEQKAQNIADRAKSKALSTGNQAVIALNAQDTLLAAQRHNTQQALNQTMGSLAKNIYQAQRKQRLQQAMSGMVGTVETLRQETTLNNEIANELISVVNQSEANAVNLAAQQAAINEQIVQSTAQDIMDIYADDLINEGNEAVSRDYGREAWNGFTGFLSGAVGGLGLGFLTKWGMGGGAIKAGIAGAGLALGGTFAGTSLYNSLNGDEPDYNLFDNQNQWAAMTTAAGGAMIGGIGKKLLNLGDKAAARKFQNIFSYSLSKTKMAQNIGARAAAMAAKNGATGIAGKVLYSGGKMLAKVPLFTLATAGIGGIVGAVQAGSVKHYKVNMDKLAAQDTFKAFKEFGIDMSQMESVINKKTR